MALSQQLELFGCMKIQISYLQPTILILDSGVDHIGNGDLLAHVSDGRNLLYI